MILTGNCEEKMARQLLDEEPELLDLSSRETRKWLKKVYNDLYPVTMGSITVEIALVCSFFLCLILITVIVVHLWRNYNREAIDRKLSTNSLCLSTDTIQ